MPKVLIEGARCLDCGRVSNGWRRVRLSDGVVLERKPFPVEYDMGLLRERAKHMCMNCNGQMQLELSPVAPVAEREEQG